MSDPGPWRIIETDQGDFCSECYADMFPIGERVIVHQRTPDGVCDCCGGDVVAGEMLDYDHPLL